MANNLTGNPLYITEVNGAKTGSLTIQSIAWVSDENSGDDIAAADFFIVTDTVGRRIASKVASFAGDDGYWSFPSGLKVDGIKVTSLDGGICYIYLV